MAESNRDEGKPPRITRSSQSKSSRTSTRRFCADINFAGRIEIHTSTSAKKDTALVYIFRDATGLSKIGFSQSLKSRVAQVHSTMPFIHRPVRLVRAIKVQRDLAYKIERLTQYMLRQNRAIGLQTGTSIELREWFSVPPNIASLYLNIALVAVQKKASELGHTKFNWRRALATSQV